MSQDLADLGPDGVPRMEPLWEWTCPLTGGLQVVCMAWNKKVPDMLAVGYGTQAFSKAAAAAGMGSGCYGSQAASGKQGAAGGPGDTGALAASKSVANSVAAAAGAGGNDDQAEDTPVHGMVAFWSLKHPEFPLWCVCRGFGVSKGARATTTAAECGPAGCRLKRARCLPRLLLNGAGTSRRGRA